MEERKRIDQFWDAVSHMEEATREVINEIRLHVEAMVKLEVLMAYFAAMLRVAIEQRQAERASIEQEAQRKAAEDS